MNDTKTCCVTGHRPQKLSFGFHEEDERCIRLKELLRLHILDRLEQHGVTHFISGMALGVDLYAAEIVLAEKSTSSRNSVGMRPALRNAKCPLAGGAARTLLRYPRKLRQNHPFANTLHTGLYAKAQPLYGHASRLCACRLGRNARRHPADGAIRAAVRQMYHYPRPADFVNFGECVSEGIEETKRQQGSKPFGLLPRRGCGV